jgi:hypothetical protein
MKLGMSAMIWAGRMIARNSPGFASGCRRSWNWRARMSGTQELGGARAACLECDLQAHEHDRGEHARDHAEEHRRPPLGAGSEVAEREQEWDQQRAEHSGDHQGRVCAACGDVSLACRPLRAFPLTCRLCAVQVSRERGLQLGRRAGSVGGHGARRTCRAKLLRGRCQTRVASAVLRRGARLATPPPVVPCDGCCVFGLCDDGLMIGSTFTDISGADEEAPQLAACEPP